MGGDDDGIGIVVIVTSGDDGRRRVTMGDRRHRVR